MDTRWRRALDRGIMKLTTNMKAPVLGRVAPSNLNTALVSMLGSLLDLRTLLGGWSKLHCSLSIMMKSRKKRAQGSAVCKILGSFPPAQLDLPIRSLTTLNRHSTSSVVLDLGFLNSVDSI